MSPPPPRRDQATASNQRSPQVPPPASTAIKNLPLPPLSSTYSFYIHRPSHFSADLILYDTIDSETAYRVVTRPHRPFSKSPNVYIYRGPPEPNAPARASTSHRKNEENPDQTVLATARLSRISLTIPLAINDRSVELQRRTLGFYKFAVAWPSSRGNMRWKHGKLSLNMQLVDEKGTLLGGFDPKSGSEGRLGRLWVQDVEEELVKQWVDEVVCVALIVLAGLLSRS